MAESVKLTRAVVTGFKQGDPTVLKDYKTDKGATIFSFRVETRVNDRVDNSPRLYRKCSYFVKTDDEVKTIKKLVTMGAVLEVEGQTNRKSFDDKATGKKVYYDEISVSGLTAIQVGADAPTPVSDEDLPF